jgi:hypothetical protein
LSDDQQKKTNLKLECGMWSLSNTVKSRMANQTVCLLNQAKIVLDLNAKIWLLN